VTKVHIELQRVQTWLFAVPRLRAMVGANALLGETLRVAQFASCAETFADAAEQITPQKWLNFYTKVLARFAAAKDLKLTLTVDANPEEGVSKAKIEEMRVALRGLGMSEDMDLSGSPEAWMSRVHIESQCVRSTLHILAHEAKVPGQCVAGTGASATRQSTGGWSNRRPVWARGALRDKAFRPRWYS